MEFAFKVLNKFREVGKAFDVFAGTWSSKKFPFDRFFEDNYLQVPMDKGGGVVANFDDVIRVK